VRDGGKRADPTKLASYRVSRCFCATDLLEDGYEIFTMQKLAVHNDGKTTMTYAHILNR